MLRAVSRSFKGVLRRAAIGFTHHLFYDDAHAQSLPLQLFLATNTLHGRRAPYDDARHYAPPSLSGRQPMSFAVDAFPPPELDIDTVTMASSFRRTYKLSRHARRHVPLK